MSGLTCDSVFPRGPIFNYLYYPIAWHSSRNAEAVEHSPDLGTLTMDYSELQCRYALKDTHSRFQWQHSYTLALNAQCSK